MSQTEAFKGRIVELYRRTGDFDETVRRAAAETSGSSRFGFIDMELQTTVLKAVVRNALRDGKLLSKATAP